jgi:hypothetical protein
MTGGPLISSQYNAFITTVPSLVSVMGSQSGRCGWKTCVVVKTMDVLGAAYPRAARARGVEMVAELLGI